MNRAPTPGKWRWELNLKSKQIQLCGGNSPFDLLVMDFVRWGMGGAAPRFITGPDNMNIMRRAETFGVIVPGREHHASWFQGINHPDARLIEAAPDLLAAVGPVLAAANEKQNITDADWNPEAHVEITLTIAELRAMLAAVQHVRGKPTEESRNG